MNNLLNVISIEFKKAWRSKMLFITLLIYLFIPVVGVGFMIILQHPEKAKALGIISLKAQILSGGVAADWKGFLNFISQAAIGGLIIFSFIAAWVFGREYIDKKLKDLLALPTSRTTIVIGKIVLITVWSLIFTSLSLTVAIALGLAIKLPGWDSQLLLDSASRYLVASVMAVLLSWAVAFVANLGKSYFPAIGFAFFMMALAQISAVLGWGQYFPWAIPGLYSNPANPVALGMISYIIVVLTGLLGVLGTVWWWRYADHSY
jgi:ABC-2 type transport system permease protein